METMEYKVMMGFTNYLGEVYDVTQIASFCSRTRAEQYAEMCNEAECEDAVYFVRED